MIGETPEWALWAMVGLLAFIMLVPVLKHERPALPQFAAARIALAAATVHARAPVGSCCGWSSMFGRRQKEAVGLDDAV
jgi:hypothetical protein